MIMMNKLNFKCKEDQYINICICWCYQCLPLHVPLISSNDYIITHMCQKKTGEKKITETDKKKQKSQQQFCLKKNVTKRTHD